MLVFLMIVKFKKGLISIGWGVNFKCLIGYVFWFYEFNMSVF